MTGTGAATDAPPTRSMMPGAGGRVLVGFLGQPHVPLDSGPLGNSHGDLELLAVVGEKLGIGKEQVATQARVGVLAHLGG